MSPIFYSVGTGTLVYFRYSSLSRMDVLNLGKLFKKLVWFCADLFRELHLFHVEWLSCKVTMKISLFPSWKIYQIWVQCVNMSHCSSFASKQQKRLRPVCNRFYDIKARHFCPVFVLWTLVSSSNTCHLPAIFSLSSIMRNTARCLWEITDKILEGVRYYRPLAFLQ